MSELSARFPSFAVSKPVILFAVFLMLLAGLPAEAAAEPPAMVGHWEGPLTFRGAEMGLRIHIQSQDDTLAATLDIPSMLMAWEPIPGTSIEKGVQVELPFGIGALAIERNGDKAHATKAVGEDTMELRLERASPPPFERREVWFTSGDTKLAGTLVVPEGKEPHPAVVLLHGSGRQGKHTYEYRSWADLLAREGLAAFYYDKRGVGSSEGDLAAGLRQLADDGLAAVRYARSQPEIDPQRVGLKGGSQGAWLAEQVAADLGDVAFLLLVSAASGTPRDQEMQKIEYGMRSDGLPESEIEDALAYLGLYFYVARTGEGWPLLEAAIRRAQEDNSWGQYVDQPESAADLAWWRENHAFQPAEVVASLDLPVLLLYGGDDWITPPIENAHKLKSLFPSPEKVEIHAFLYGDHRLELGMGPDAEGRWQWPRIAPAMKPAVASWLDRYSLR